VLQKHPKKTQTRKGRSNKNGDGEASCGTIIDTHRKRMADYDVSVYKDVLLAFSELTLCFLCQKQATDCKSDVNGLQRYVK